jgi:alanine racemase
MGMVKSDAYGHGALPVARKLEELGAEYLGVACLDEALELRQGGVGAPILILGGTAPEDAPALVKYHLAQTVFDLDTAKVFSKAAKASGGEITIHIKVDTGMTRLGYFCDENCIDSTAALIAETCSLPGLCAEGIFTHFADSDGDEEYTMRQLVLFLSLLDKLNENGYHFHIRHAANSAATLLYPCSHLDMVRPGLALYGHYPGSDMEVLCNLLPVMELKSRITSVKTVPAGASVSYGRTHVLEKEKTLAVIPIGYGDGFFRGFSNAFSVNIHGKSAPIVGRVCMDMCMVDVSEIPDVFAGDEVIVYGRDRSLGQTIEDGAERVQTISYELLCALSKRIPRIYI